MARDTGEFPGAVKAPAGLPRDDPGRPRQGRCSEGRGALQRPRDRSAGGRAWRSPGPQPRPTRAALRRRSRPGRPGSARSPG